jgi:hypothetical protein
MMPTEIEKNKKCSGLGPCHGMQKIEILTHGMLCVAALKKGNDLILRTLLMFGRTKADFEYCPACGTHLVPLRPIATPASNIIKPS